ncbi:hypothetical protein [Candidatus Palauibacter polyketidifaciens]|uniref:hypothetical protein n=1 Tax=Candidatus Palauibacter polyketidifaciens TaxID=3056740 RepID=UPI00139DF13D|nr:hypothetical protein [Candidatus Palauibacter polyketidifaciens]MDE2720371.1 hypothetical protein [Candidatus Palauibacter polyketidifaciens]MYE33617.1 hypothetical protein [Gemmatimonadales bacterium]
MSASDVSIAALARRCFEREAKAAERELDAELARSRTRDPRSVTHWVVPLVIVGSCYAGVVSGGPGMFGVLGVAAVLWALNGLGKAHPARQKRSAIRKEAEDGIVAYRRREPWAVLRVHDYAVTEFRERIQAHRERTLGRGSEWGQARSELTRAADEAQRSAAYWRERLRDEPESELARTQGRVADRLEAKLGEALRKLDGRAAALRKFYNDCDARLAVMDRCNRDIEESQRLEELSGKADVVIAEAEGTIQALALQFVAEARNIAEALGGVATVGIKSLAGEAPVDNIEYLADHIIESSDRERSAIEDLERQLSQAAR